jgi:hypothetical protein
VRDKSLNTTQLFLQFADFSAEVDHKVSLGANVAQIGAIGVYSSAANQIGAQLGCVVFE